MSFAALTLTHPQLMWGVALVALPLIAHLLNRKSRRRIVFPTIRFLQQSSAAQSRFFKLRRWFILALRGLAVSLIAAAFARPLWTAHRPSAVDPSRPVGLVVVLDMSLSTQQSSGSGPLWESMRSRAARLLDSLQPGRDVANIVLASDRPTGLFPRLSPNVSSLRDDLRTISAGFSRADWPRALAAAGELLANHQGPRRVVVLSDLQKSNWKELEESTENGLAWGTELTFIEPEAPAPSNGSLSAPRCAPPKPLVGQECQCIVRLTSDSEEIREVPVAVKIEGVECGRQIVRMGPREERDVAFSHTFVETAPQAAEFSIPEDGLRADNQAALIVEPAQRLPVLIVSTGDAAEPGSGLFFLVRALAPTGSASDHFDVRVVAPGSLQPADLTAAGVVFLEELAGLAPGPAEMLAGHLKSGGGIVVMAGHPSMPGVLQSLNSVGGGVGLLPFVPGGLRDLSPSKEPLTIGGGQWRSRLLRDFDEQSQLALAQIPFRRVMTAKALHPEAESLLTFSNGAPALAMRQIGAGRLLVASFSADVASSDFGKYGSFVALTQSLARELRTASGGPSPPLVGRPWQSQRPIDPKLAESAIEVVDPEGRRSPAAVLSRDEERWLSLENPKRPGVYRFESAGRILAQTPVAVDPRESRLERLTAEEARRLMSRRNQTSHVIAAEEVSAAMEPPGQPWWHLLAAVALGLLTVEMLCLLVWKR